MARKLTFTLITLFWLTMNALLWRAEFSGRDLGAAVPVALVWEKMLRSPDDSGLAVNLGKVRVGFVRWAPNLGQEFATRKTSTETAEIEGRDQDLVGYTVHTEGNFILPDDGGRVRFELGAKFGDDTRWTDWSLKGVQRGLTWSLAADRKKEALEFSLGQGRDAVRQTLPFTTFRDPGKLIEAVGASGQVPALAAILPSLGLGGTNTASLSLGLAWEARQDFLQMGGSRVKVYNLRARLFDKYEVVVIISRVGEILRVDLPGELKLVNEALVNL